MTQKKSQNSLLLLTTLGVYLGLLVAGAAPGVVAQQAAAMTRNFELSDEIEVKDDLDKDPEDCSEKASDQAIRLLNFDIISDGILDFVTEIDQLTKIGKTSWSHNFNFEFVRKTSGGTVTTWYEAHSGNAWAQLASSENLENLVSLICPWSGCDYYRYDQDLKTEASVTKIKYRLSERELSVEIGIEKGNVAESEQFSKIYEEVFRIGACSSIYATPEQQLIYQNTSSSIGNNQVFIVTRLPRAALEQLLATGVK